MKLLAPVLTAALLFAACAPTALASATPEPPRTVSIPFVNHGGIRDWRASDSRTLYVQDRRRQWYRATLFAPCIDLPFAQAVGFETRGGDTFDRFSAIRVRGERCTLRDLEHIEGPPPKRARG